MTFLIMKQHCAVIKSTMQKNMTKHKFDDYEIYNDEGN